LQYQGAKYNTTAEKYIQNTKEYEEFREYFKKGLNTNLKAIYTREFVLEAQERGYFDSCNKFSDKSLAGLY